MLFEILQGNSRNPRRTFSFELKYCDDYVRYSQKGDVTHRRGKKKPNKSNTPSSNETPPPTGSNDLLLSDPPTDPPSDPQLPPRPAQSPVTQSPFTTHTQSTLFPRARQKNLIQESYEIVYSYRDIMKDTLPVKNTSCDKNVTMKNVIFDQNVSCDQNVNMKNVTFDQNLTMFDLNSHNFSNIPLDRNIDRDREIISSERAKKLPPFFPRLQLLPRGLNVLDKTIMQSDGNDDIPVKSGDLSLSDIDEGESDLGLIDKDIDINEKKDDNFENIEENVNEDTKDIEIVVNDVIEDTEANDDIIVVDSKESDKRRNEKKRKKKKTTEKDENVKY